MSESITVYIVDGEASVRCALTRLMTAGGFRVMSFSSVNELMQQNLPTSDAALLIDLSTARQHDASLHQQLFGRGLKLPVIYLTDCDSQQTRREAKRSGAAGYFRKPVDGQALADAIYFAVQNFCAKADSNAPHLS